MSPPALPVAAPRGPVVGKSLIAVVGSAVALLLFTHVPADESGRTVRASLERDGSVSVQHVDGREYLRSYADIVGMWTICDGITPGVRPGMVETRTGCLLRLEAELVRHARGVLRCVPGLGGAGRDHQRYAAVSLAYNIGVSAFCGSTAARRFNARAWRAGCDAMLAWNKAGRPLRVVRGLQLRRGRERAICLKGLPA